MNYVFILVFGNFWFKKEKDLLKFEVLLFLLTAGFAYAANIDVYLLTFIKYFFLKTDPLLK